MRILLAVAAALALAAATPAQTVTKYNILFDGKSSGSQTTRKSEGGSIDVVFTYRDNGRGPDLKEDFSISDDGTFLHYSVKGTSTFGATIEETFVLDGDKADWRSTSDRASAKVTGPAAYVPVECSSEVMARVFKAVAKKPGGKLKALPGGELSVEKVLDERVEAGVKGRDVSLYSLKGLFEEPYYVWLTKEPELELFATISPGWMQLIESGWESAAGKLEARQVAADDKVLGTLATKLRHRLAEPIVIRNARVFDSEHAKLGPAKDVYINRGRIAAIYDTGSPAQGAATVIDAEGRTLLPGLFDMHGHLTSWEPLRHLAAGVTSVRDMANDNKFLNGMIDNVEKGTLIGPHIIPAGFIEGSTGYSAKSGFVCGTIDEVKKAIDWYAQHGYPQIKIYNSFYREWLPEAVNYAHDRGLRVSGHVPAFLKAEDVVRHGFDEIQHINQVMLNFFVKPDTDTRTLARFDLVAQSAYRLDLQSPKVKDFIGLLKSKQIVIDPTLTCFEGMFVQKQGDMNPSYAAIADHLPLATQRACRQWNTRTAANS